jgi:hypothetical protein
MLPIVRINNKLVITEESSNYSIMLDAIVKKGNAHEFLHLTENYLQNPRVILYDVIPGVNINNMYMQYLEEAGVVSYGLLPVYYNNHIAGILEVYTKQKGLLTQNSLYKLETAIPLLAQLMQNAIDEFDIQIDNIIKEKFTSLQPSVQWKFNEAAWHYLNNNKHPNQLKPIENIAFKQVYPLYGAVDIRNSTVERNMAQAADFKTQFELLEETLLVIKEQVNIELVNELVFKTRKWLDAIDGTFMDDDHLRMVDFLELDILPFLQHFKESNPSLAPVINRYFEAIDEQQGIVFHNRRMLEQSMQTINTAVNHYLLSLLLREVQDVRCGLRYLYRSGHCTGQAIQPTVPEEYPLMAVEEHGGHSQDNPCPATADAEGTLYHPIDLHTLQHYRYQFPK